MVELGDVSAVFTDLRVDHDVDAAEVPSSADGLALRALPLTAPRLSAYVEPERQRATRWRLEWK